MVCLQKCQMAQEEWEHIKEHAPHIMDMPTKSLKCLNSGGLSLGFGNQLHHALQTATMAKELVR